MGAISFQVSRNSEGVTRTHSRTYTIRITENNADRSAKPAINDQCDRSTPKKSPENQLIAEFQSGRISERLFLKQPVVDDVHENQPESRTLEKRAK